MGKGWGSVVLESEGADSDTETLESVSWTIFVAHVVCGKGEDIEWVREPIPRIAEVISV